MNQTSNSIVSKISPWLLIHSTCYFDLGSFSPASRPADSGVGASCNNMTSKDSFYLRRQFTPAFHDLTTQCLQLEAIVRPSSSELLVHPFFKQIKKSSGSLCSYLEKAPAINAKLERISGRRSAEMLSGSMARVQLGSDGECEGEQDIEWNFSDHEWLQEARVKVYPAV